ncbi:hypothetical protein FISHEDRAFT_70313 [Fistulina hepatica ATCC 64428]|uniref:Uncharacterized protein n=1 Tax=Fistulina hepatica ATCC 64428 TaxID=1128425 RepID=A0A0D7AKG3_9AGAR|nr:hypothetical protein FISHEDRAFT_70313 [Fistulina hepatica ATCC 64428]
MLGGVQAYTVNLDGKRHETTSEAGVEIYLSALLHAILYSDDTTYYFKLCTPANRDMSPCMGHLPLWSTGAVRHRDVAEDVSLLVSLARSRMFSIVPYLANTSEEWKAS